MLPLLKKKNNTVFILTEMKLNEENGTSIETIPFKNKDKALKYFNKKRGEEISRLKEKKGINVNESDAYSVYDGFYSYSWAYLDGIDEYSLEISEHEILC